MGGVVELVKAIALDAEHVGPKSLRSTKPF